MDLHLNWSDWWVVANVDWQQRLAWLALALILDGIIGDPQWLWRKIPHPVSWVGGLIGFMDKKFNRGGAPERSRFIAGLWVSTVILLLAVAFGYGLAQLKFYVTWGGFVEIACVTILLAQKSLFLHVWQVRQALRREEQQETHNHSWASSRDAVSKIVGRDPQSLDQYGIARAGVESLAENFADGVVAPALFYLVFGLPGICFYKALNTLDSMIGHHNLRYEWFGKAAARLDDAANFIPARLAGLWLALAAIFTPTASLRRAIITMFRDARRHRSINAGWPEAALAGALDFALAGPRKYHGTIVSDGWIGDGRARLNWRDMDKGLLLYAIACVVQFLAVMMVVIALG